MTGIELIIVICVVLAIAWAIRTGFRKGQFNAKSTKVVRVNDFFQKYKSVMSDELMKKISDETLQGNENMRVDIYTIEMLDNKLSQKENVN